MTMEKSWPAGRAEVVHIGSLGRHPASGTGLELGQWGCYWYWSRSNSHIGENPAGLWCAAVEQWYFREASGLVLELLEAEPAGTARHRTRQPGEISRPSSRQKHG